MILPTIRAPHLRCFCFLRVLVTLVPALDEEFVGAVALSTVAVEFGNVGVVTFSTLAVKFCAVGVVAFSTVAVEFGAILIVAV